MPGNSEKRPCAVPSTRPPSYVNVPTQVAYASVPDALVVTMIRILGLCWTSRYRYTPPLTFEQLAHLLDRPRTTLQRHLDILERELGWLRRECQDRRFVLYPCPPFSMHSAPEDAEGRSFASAKLPGDERKPSHVAGGSPANGHNCAPGTSVAVELPANDQGCAPSTSVAGELPANGHNCAPGTSVAVEPSDSGRTRVHGAALAVESPDHDHRCSHDDPRPLPEVLATRQDLIRALADVGIENPARERIALDPAIKPDWVTAWQLWAEHPARANLSNLPGYIVSCLKHRERPPENYLRLVRLTSAEKAQLRRSRWDGAGDLDPDLRAIRPLYIQHFVDQRRG